MRNVWSNTSSSLFRRMSNVNIHLKSQYFSKLEFGTSGVAAAPAKPAKGGKAAAVEEEPEDKLVLNNAEQGKVVTRFPPEASGFLHIGHAKAALVNRMLADKYGGKMIFRFDDTNPVKEKHHFEEAIKEDMGFLGVSWEVGVTYSSDYFDKMMELAEGMIQAGTAYCDNTPREEMQKCRYDGIATACRDNSVEKNLAMWEEMKKGSESGQEACLRAKLSIDDANKCLRDPVMYRVNLTPHTRTGSKYNVYPTYDFCCPIVDSIEGVTHALRTNEYHDRNAQYDWFCKTLDIRNPLLEDFSRLNMEYTVMSKRKLTRFVEEGTVDGWNDPRFPTVRALIRRGLKIDALREFVKVQGMSKTVNFMEWSKLWNFNQQILDPSVPRYTAVAKDLGVECTVVGQAPGLEAGEKPRHMKNPDLGSKTYFKSDKIFLDAEDVALCADKEEVTLMAWGNAFISNIQKDEKGIPVSAELTPNPTGDVKKTKQKLHWIPKNDDNVTLVLNEYDHLLTKKKPDPEETLDNLIQEVTRFTQTAVGEAAMTEVKQGDTIQIERRGFYICDKVEDKTLTFIYIPDGKEKVGHLSAKAQYLKSIGAMPAAGDAKSKPKGTKAEENLTLEEKRALKAAKKAAAAGNKK